MASEDLLKKAVAAFNALSPEQQAEMLEEQRQSWVRGNVGLSRDERGMTSPMMRALQTVREVNDAGRQAVKAWVEKSRPAPAATDTALETVGYLTGSSFAPLKERGSTLLLRDSPNEWPEKYKGSHALVTRSQADELLAAEREAQQRLLDIIEEANEDKEALEAKLATANALVTCCCGDLVDAHNMGSGHSPVDQYHYAMMQLEAKLAAQVARIKDLQRVETELCTSIGLLEVKLAAATELLRQSRRSLKRAPFNLFKDIDDFLAALGGKPS